MAADAVDTTIAPTVTTHEDGTVTFEAGGRSVTVADPAVAAQEAERTETRGAAFIRELRSRRGPLVERHEILGVEYFLLRMDDTTRGLVAEYTARWGDGSLRLDRPEVQGAFKRAVIQCGLVQGEKDLTPLFNLEPQVMEDPLGNPITTTEIELFCMEPDAPIKELFDLLTDINPALWPEKKMVEEIGEKIIRGEV